jgi:hypothetical protein
MRRILILGAAVLIVLAAPASADKKGAKVYKAHLEATEAATAAGIPDARGRAQLVDGKKNNKVSLHMKGLEPGETYLWHVHQATAEGDPCAAGSTVGNPTPYPGWTYRALTANESGNANSKGTSTTFPVAEEDTGGDYYVNVHLQDLTVVACGVLERKQRGRQQGKTDDGDKQQRGKSHSEHGNGKGHDEG